MNQEPQKKKSSGGEEATDVMSEFGRKKAAPKAAEPPKASPAEKKPTPPPEPPKPAPKKAEPSPAKTATSKKETVKKEKTPSKPAEKKEKRSEKKSDAATGTDRSERALHKVLPYVFTALALFIGISLLLNLFCNFDNQLKNDPGAHWMGKIGYYLSYALFGLFGGAVFTLPLILINLAIYWKRYITHRLTISKIVASALFLVFFSALIHVFVLIGIPDGFKNLTVAQLMEYGAQMRGGGVIGGKLGYLLFQCGSYVGGALISTLVLAASLFYFLGMTPQNLWSKLRLRRSEKKLRKKKSLSEEEAENAKNQAAMDEKFRRVRATQLTIDDENPDNVPVGSVRVVEGSKESKLAPMPMPKLDPNDGSRLFIPSDVNKKMREGTPVSPASAPAVTPTVPVNRPKAAPAQPASAPTARTVPAPTEQTASNKDTAVDPIFPKSNDPRQVRRVPKEHRNFDLKNIFIDLDDDDNPSPTRHAALPPEVPMSNGQGAAPARAAAPRREAAPASVRSVGAGATAAKPASASPARPTAPQRTPATAGTSASSKTVFRQADKAQQKSFGLSDEEFEQMEAQKNGTTLPAKKKPTPAKAEAKTKTAEKSKTPEPPVQKYVFPPLSYLHPGEPMTAENRAEIEQSMRQLADTLESFRVRVQEINFSFGPTVTRYEVILAPGVRVRSVTALADDIALALRSSGGVRIEAPIPGTNAVGIEIPNKTRSTIYLRDLIESKEFTQSGSKLTACLGADIAGQPTVFDIAKMPHLLIAGTTGSGKSVCINCIITSLLYKVRPDEVKLILIDPKKVEFSIYKNIPHLMAPVVTLPKDAAGALQAAVEEMERRFEIFEGVGVRDIKGYNEITADDPDMPYMPHMVIIIDELADLMMTAKNEVETAICRIAQKARAAGMHLIIGTQRPSADVVTGLIKANVPSSIAFAVKSQIDSRVILDHGGAEALTGKGDMLFVPIGSMRDTRIQGAFVSDKEVEKICEFIRATNGTAQYDEKFTSKLKELAAQCGGSKAKNDDVPVGADGEKADDPKYADAVRVAVEEKRISTSLLQRKLEVGYSRAAKLIDRMQAEGIVSPPDGSKPRSVLITPEQYLEKFFSEEAEE